MSVCIGILQRQTIWLYLRISIERGPELLEVIVLFLLLLVVLVLGPRGRLPAKLVYDTSEYLQHDYFDI